ncbi:MAG: 30S ribosome-binding factor RbfA [Planctomycetes bacterium]|nr:30S ribosome-binding factor RbfA [Planctomycetota bacterium]
MASRHLLRVASRIKFLVSSVLQREMKDPRLGFITLLKVEPTEDFKEAKVYFSVLGSPGDRSKTLHALEDARGFIQKKIAKNLRLRNIPQLRFILDEPEDKLARIEKLIEKVHEEKEGEPEAPAPDVQDEAEDPDGG